MMLWSQLQFATSLNTIDKQLRMLRTFHLNLAFDEIGIVHIESEQAHALTILQRWEHTTIETAIGLRSQGDGAHQ